MKCDHAKSLFLAYHDGDLSEDEHQVLKAHLDECESCASEWRAYKQTLGEVSGMFQITPPNDFAERVKHTIGRRSRGRFFGEQRVLSISFALVSFILILLFLLTYIFVSADREITLVAPSSESKDAQKGDGGEKTSP
jgi:anti-sigma factor RsiW